MKTNSTFVVTFILLLLVSMQLIMPQQAEACDWCNNKFFMELNTTRKGTFASDELLRSIHAQHDFSQPMAATSGNFVRDAYENIASFGTSAEAVQILSRDARIPTRPTGFVPQNTRLPSAFASRFRKVPFTWATALFTRASPSITPYRGPM
jgi:hypothetical protein